MKHKSFSKLIRKADIFGKVIELNFDGNGPTHKTYFGGIISIFYFVFIMAYATYGFSNM